MTDTNGLLRSLRAHWSLFAAVVLVCLGAAIGVWAATPYSFVASIDTYVSAQSQSNDAQSAYQGSLLSQQQTRSYTQLITSPRILADVQRATDGRVGQEEASRRLAASAAPETTLITISYTSDDAGESARVVNVVGDSFNRLIAGLERPVDPRRAPTVVARTVEAAALPTSPVGPSLLLHMVVGLVAGVLVGLLAIMARFRLSTTVRGNVEIERAEGLGPVLGSVPAQEDKGKGGYHPLLQVGPQAEELRRVRTNIQFLGVDRPLRSIVVTSALPGEGKTSTSLGLAQAVAAAGWSVVLVEADLRKPSIAAVAGLPNEVGLTSVLTKRAKAQDCLHRVGGNLDVLTSGPLPPNPSELLGSGAMRNLIEALLTSHAFLILDTPPLLPVTDGAVVSAHVDGTLLVCRAGRTTVQQATNARSRLNASANTYLGVIINFARGGRRSEYGPYGGYVSERGDVSEIDSDITATLGPAQQARVGNHHRDTTGQHSDAPRRLPTDARVRGERGGDL